MNARGTRDTSTRCKKCGERIGRLHEDGVHRFRQKAIVVKGGCVHAVCPTCSHENDITTPLNDARVASAARAVPA